MAAEKILACFCTARHGFSVGEHCTLLGVRNLMLLTTIMHVLVAVVNDLN